MNATFTPCDAFDIVANGIKIPAMVVTAKWECFQKLENAAGDIVYTWHAPSLSEQVSFSMGASAEKIILGGSVALMKRIAAAEPPRIGIDQLKIALAKVWLGGRPGDEAWCDLDYEALEFALDRKVERVPLPTFEHPTGERA